MTELLNDIWPILMAGLMTVIGWQWKEAHAIKIRVAVMERTIEDLQKIIESMKQRQDSHSKKQDEILTLINDFKLEVVKQIGEMSADLKALTSSLEVYDDSLSLRRKKKA